MPSLELPHTRGCLVCGRDNPHGLHLHLRVDQASGAVSTTFVPGPEHIGFEGVIHGGVLATVLDEAMVWAATWAGKRFCMCAEMTVRFKHSARVGQKLRIEASVAIARSRLLATNAAIYDADAHQILAVGLGKYVPVDPPRHRDFVATLVDEPSTQAAAHAFQ